MAWPSPTDSNQKTLRDRRERRESPRPGNRWPGTTSAHRADQEESQS